MAETVEKTVAKEEKVSKPRGKKTPPLSPEEYAAEVAKLVADWMPIQNYYAGTNKPKHILPEGAPSKSEFQGLIKMLESSTKLYEKLHKKPKKTPAPKTPSEGGAKNNLKGFKQAKFVSRATAEFVNAHGELPAPLHLQPLPAANGDAIWNIAQATQLFQSYVERKHLKDVAKRSIITFDTALTALFKPCIEKIDKKKVTTTEDGRFIINHNTFQGLIPLLFVPPLVPAKYIDTVEQKRSDEREAVLARRTLENVQYREAEKDKVREAHRLEREAKRKNNRAVLPAEPTITSTVPK
jgi:hypothetical protein